MKKRSYETIIGSLDQRVERLERGNQNLGDRKLPAGLRLPDGSVIQIRKSRDLSGIRFERLVALYPSSIKNGNIYWACRCDCGKESEVASWRLKETKSCGCLTGESAKKRFGTHEMSKTAIYNVWGRIKARCENPKSKRWKDYGGRGIKICVRWRKFENFFSDMGHKPTPEHTIERKDNDGNYEPSNCVWATMLEQARNKRNNVILNLDGESKLLSEWSRVSGINTSLIQYRIRVGWILRDAIFKKPR